ncbi:MAG TPA: LuxR C-terminal-related transcriptional regulator [Actinomycetota bacterium]|nr:LuxR C-terminal-related transcriptional regulator [Actinomycetota bacterium]
MPSVFVGRVWELDALARVIGFGKARSTAAALVTGDPGSGKTRLLAEASARVDVANRFRVDGYETEQNVALGAASGFLRELGQVEGDGRMLQEVVFQASGLETSAIEPVRVFEIAHRALGERQPALLLMDDLQWLDPLSVALIHYLVTAAHDTGTSLILWAAGRPSANATALAASLERVLPSTQLVQLDLEGLERGDGIALIRQLAPEVSELDAGELWAKADGFPFWLEASVEGGGIAPDIGAVVTRRLRGASADAAALLSILAVADRPLAPADVAELKGWPVERIDRSAAELAARGLVTESWELMRLAHDLIRDAALTELPTDKKRQIHRDLAGWLEPRAGDDLGLLQQTLEHRRAGGLPVLDLVERVAHSPRRRLLGHEGLDQLERIVDEADQDRTALPAQRAVASLAMELGSFDRALARWSAIAELKSPSRDRAAALLAASKAASELDRPTEALSLLTRARALNDRDELFRLEADAHEASIKLWLEKQTSEGRAIARDAAARARRMLDEAGGLEAVSSRQLEVSIDLLGVACEAAVQDGDVLATLEAVQEWAAAARSLPPEASLAASLALGQALVGVDRLQEGGERIRQVWSEAHRLVMPRMVIDAGFWFAEWLAEAGQLRDAEQVSAEISTLASRVGDVPRGRFRLTRLTRRLAIERGHWADGILALERDAAGEPSEHLRIALHQDLAIWLARVHRESGASEVLENLAAARSCAAAAGCPRCGGELLIVGAEALAHIGRVDDGNANLARWDETHHQEPGWGWLRRRTGALLQVRTGRGGDAASDLAKVRRQSEQDGRVLEALWTRLYLAEALLDTDRRKAAAGYRSIAESATELGAGTIRQLADRALRSLGGRTWGRGPAPSVGGSPLDRLTTREREIAFRVAHGESNPEIARVLFLSRKTVERHVSNILAKLGTRNRTELAAMMGKEEPNLR